MFALVWQIHQAWPPAGFQAEFFALQALGLVVFLVYGLGWAYGSNSLAPVDVTKAK